MSEHPECARAYIHILEAELARTQQSLAEAEAKHVQLCEKLDNVWRECFHSIAIVGAIRIQCYKENAAKYLAHCRVVVRLKHRQVITSRHGYNKHNWFQLLADRGYIHEEPGYDCLSASVEIIGNGYNNSETQMRITSMTEDFKATWVGGFGKECIGSFLYRAQCYLADADLTQLLSQCMEVGFPISVTEDFERI